MLNFLQVPLFYQHTINETTRLGIWQIQEEEPFFLSRVSVHRNISHPHKRLQHLAGRYLLQYLFPGFPYELIQIADTRKPFIPNESYHFSISHCGDFAAAIVSTVMRVGVDIELVKPSIEKVQHKFLTPREMELVDDFRLADNLSLEQVLTLCWSCKESVYKWYGLGGVDFKEHIRLQKVEKFGNGFISVYAFTKDISTDLSVRSQFFDELVLSVVSS